MKVLVCGGRRFSDRHLLFRVMDALHKEHRVTLVIHGAQRGADNIAERWARERELPFVGVPAKWTVLGTQAGPTRNRFMVTEWKPDLVIAFPGNRGTRNMVAVANEMGIPVIQSFEVNLEQ